MSKTFMDLIEMAKGKKLKKISVALAQDKEVLEAIKMARDEKIVEPILVGDKEKIIEIADSIDFDLKDVLIIDEKDDVKAARKAVELVSSKKADVLMKGLVGTPIIMKQVLDKEIGLRTGKVISHIAVFTVETYHKMLFVTDAAMNIAPNLEQKKEIIENAVDLCHSLEIKEPKVGVLAANEKVSPKMIATIDAEKLKNMNIAGDIDGCIIDGPLALDNAVSKKAAQVKGIESDVAGDVDIILAPSIEAGNTLYKSLTYLANAKSAGIVVGTKAPMVLTSRADDKEAKLYSIALSVLMASGDE